MCHHKDWCAETTCDICSPDWRTALLVDQATQQAKNRTYIESTVQSHETWCNTAKPQLCCTICDATPDTWTPPSKTTTTMIPSSSSSSSGKNDNSNNNNNDDDNDNITTTLPYKWFVRSVKTQNSNKKLKFVCLCPSCGMGPWHTYGPMQWRIETPSYKAIRTCRSTLWAKVGKERIRQSCDQLMKDENYSHEKPTSWQAVEQELEKRGYQTSSVITTRTTTTTTTTTASTTPTPMGKSTNTIESSLTSSSDTPNDHDTDKSNDNSNTNDHMGKKIFKISDNINKENETKLPHAMTITKKVKWNDSNVNDQNKSNNQFIPTTTMITDRNHLPALSRPNKKCKLGHHSLVGGQQGGGEVSNISTPLVSPS